VIDEDGDLATTDDQTIGIDWEFDVDGAEGDTSNPSPLLTDTEGKRIFPDLKTGNYNVIETYVAGFEIVGATCGIENGSLDGNIMYSVEVSKNINTICTFYNTPNGVVQGYKWNDINKDGIKDSDEPLLPGWTINLYKSNEIGFGETPIDSTQTGNTEDNFGMYSFDHLLPATYKVCEEQKDGWNQSYPINDKNNCYIVTLPSESEPLSLVLDVDEYNFGNYVIPPQLRITKDNNSPVEGLLSGSTVLYTIIVSAPSNEEIGLVSPPKQTEELLTAEREILLKESSTKGEVQEDNNSGDQSSSVNRQIPPISNESSEQGRGSQPVSSNRDQQSETVQYANHLLGETEEIYLIKNVKVTDILPKGFEYMSGTWTANSSVRGNIKGSITTEPEYNEGLATWNLGDMKEGEIVTLTYTAKINLLNEPGLYKDIAFVQGDSLLAKKDSGDVLGISYDPSEYLHTDTLGDNFVGTKVLVVEPIEEGGEVLGASTALILPKTGAETYITLGAIISMILGIFLLFFKKRKTSILLITFVFTIGIFTLLKPVQTYAQTTAKVSVRLEEPKIGITDREFNITYVALSIPVKPITVQCQYSLDGVNFSNFDISKTTNSGDCKVDQSIVTGSGTYYFRAIASTTDGGAESEVITVKVADKPSPVTEYSKAKAVCTYTLKFKSSTSKVQIFRSDNQKSFYADDTTLITKPYLTVTPNALSTYTDTPADCSKEYYYAVRAVDEYSNVSALVTDNVVTVVEQTQTSTSQESEEVAGEETTTQQEQETTSTGEVAGEETTAQQEEKAETDTKDETKTEEKETEESIWDKYKYLIISVIVVALGSGIYDYIRRKK
jgi:LPXTG-motif cell wall-anchored protein